jgi:Flp pilus assembly protein CpaB
VRIKSKQAVVLLVALGVIVGAAGAAAADSSFTVTPGTGPQVYSTQVVESNIPITPANTVVLTSPAIPAGNYLMTFNVTLLMTPTTNVVCDLLVNGQRPDQLSGPAGDGAKHPDIADGNATESYVVHFGQPSSVAQVQCQQSGTSTFGTVTGTVRTLTLLQVGRWTLGSS